MAKQISPKQLPPKPDWWPRHLFGQARAAELLDVSEHTLEYWRSTKSCDLPYKKVGGSVKYDPDAVWAWLHRDMVCA